MASLCTRLSSVMCCPVKEKGEELVLSMGSDDSALALSIKVVMPEHSLAPKAVQVRLERNKTPMNRNTWNTDVAIPVSQQLQNIGRIWTAQGLDYLVHGTVKRDAQRQEQAFHWEIVPFSKTRLFITRFWQQFKVLWRLTFGGIYTPIVTRRTVATQLKGEMTKATQGDSKAGAEARGKEFLCDVAKCSKQLVFTNNKMRLLLDEKPLIPRDRGVHFLIAPERHVERFEELTQAELEGMSALQNHCLDQYKEAPEITIFDKSGKEAGQTVPHWHQHLVVQERPLGKWTTLCRLVRNMLFGLPKLSKEDMSQATHELQKKFGVEKN
ncbi:MAG: HIT domain-containing protein [Parachlamydiaceae bacterium]|nr:HIT domain-containing protein [Parachlamydiaceae bacterium]